MAWKESKKKKDMARNESKNRRERFEMLIPNDDEDFKRWDHVASGIREKKKKS